MDVRVLIVPHPNHTYQVCVLAPDLARGWIKTYDSKLLLVTELRCIDLMTSDESDEALASDFEARDAMLTIHASADPEVLRAAGFTEQKPELVN